jgi:hypothetical protein
MRKAISTEDRFWAKVQKTDTCWLWTAAKSSAGYGQIGLSPADGGRVVYAHRYSYELASGATIPVGVNLDHICHVRNCVNPQHLRPVTQKQNCENYEGHRTDNTSGVRGVCWNKRARLWWAYVGHNGRLIGLGYYRDLEEAGEAARQGRLQYHTHNDADRTDQTPLI